MSYINQFYNSTASQPIINNFSEVFDVQGNISFYTSGNITFRQLTTNGLLSIDSNGVMTANVAGFYSFVLRFTDIAGGNAGGGNLTKIWFLKGVGNARVISLTASSWAKDNGTPAVVAYEYPTSNSDLTPVAYFYGKTNNSGTAYTNLNSVQSYFYMNQSDTIQLYSASDVVKTQQFDTLLVNLVAVYP
jgi:hypothetical protein